MGAVWTSLLFTCGLTLAAEGAEPWVVLVQLEGDVPTSWAGHLQRAAQAAAEESASIRWVPMPQVTVDEAQRALGCAGFEPACIGQLASMMQAEAALFVEVTPRAGGAWLSTRVIGADGAPRGDRMRYELPERGAEGLKVARVLVRAAVLGLQPTVLRIETDVPGAEVRLDGERVGTTPLTLADQVTPGRHRVELSLAGRAPFTREVDVRPGVVTRVGAVMSAAPIAPLRPSLGEELKGAGGPSADVSPGLAFGVLGAGVGVAALGGGLYVAHALHALSVPQQLNPAERQVDAEARLAQGQQLSQVLYSGAIAASVAGLVIALTGGGLVGAALVDGDEAD